MSESVDALYAMVPGRGSEEEPWVDQQDTVTSNTRRFRFVSDVGLEGLPDPTWLIDGVLPMGSLAVLYGMPGAYKSFLAADWALSIATGQSWAGRQVRHGSVLYVAAEGVNGYKLRVRSWKGDRGFVGLAGVHFLTQAVQLHDSEQVAEFVASMAEDRITPVLVVFDTLSRCFVGGEENSASAMSQVVEAVEKIRRSTGAAVLLVHHSNKAGEVERGSIVLRGAVDVMAMTKRTGKGRVKLTCVKMKDADQFEEMHFQFVACGDSGVLALTDTKGTASDEDARVLSGDRLKSLHALPSEGTTYGAWKKLAAAAGVPEGSFPKHRQALLDACLVLQEGRLYRPSGGDAPESIDGITLRRSDTKILTEAPSQGTQDTVF